MRIKLAESDSWVIGRTEWWLGFHRRYRLYSMVGWLYDSSSLCAADLPWLNHLYKQKADEFMEQAAFDVTHAADQLVKTIAVTRDLEVDLGVANIRLERYGQAMIYADITFKGEPITASFFNGEANEHDDPDADIPTLVTWLLNRSLRHLAQQIEANKKKVEQLCCLAMSADNRLRMRKAKEKINGCDKDE